MNLIKNSQITIENTIQIMIVNKCFRFNFKHSFQNS